MSLFGVTIIITGTAMCVGGWFLGHFGADEVLPKTVMDAPNATAAVGQDQSVLGVTPARGLAYAGPVVMSFGCFAVVFACVVVCETRDRVLETMEDRVRRGLPARPPGGIDADFYALVVEFRKRRVEKQRRRRKLMQCDVDDEEGLCVEYATSPLQPTPSTADFQSPSTINDFVEDHGDDAQPTLDQLLPTVCLEDTETAPDLASCDGTEELATPWCTNPSFSDNLCSTSVDVELQALAPCTSPASSNVDSLSPSWKPALSADSVRSCLSIDNDVSAPDPEPSHKSATVSVPPTTAEDKSRVSTSQLSFPLLAPISSMTQTQPFPYVRLEAASEPSISISPTYLIHTASVHAIADRSPDVLPQPDMTSFEYPPTDFRHSCDTTASGGAITSDDVSTTSRKWNSERYGDVKWRFVADVSDAASGINSAGNSVDEHDLRRREHVELSGQLHEEGSQCLDELAESSVAAVDDTQQADVVSQTKRRYCRLNADYTQSQVADRMTFSDDFADNCPDWSSTSTDDGGPSRKRPCGRTGHPRRPVRSNAAPLDDDNTPLSCSPPSSSPQPSITCVSPIGPYLICANQEATPDADDSGPLYGQPGQDGSTAVCPRRRRPNGTRPLLKVHRRRRRPDRGDFTISGDTSHVFTTLQNDPDRSSSVAHHSVDELERFVSTTSSAEKNDSCRSTRGRAVNDDQTSQLVWLRRRTTTSISPQRPYRRTSDPFQSTV